MWLAKPDLPEENSSEEMQLPPHWGHEPVSEKRCSHFSVSIATLAVPGIYPPMQVPVYQCSLTAEMVVRLRTQPEGQTLADRLEAPPLEGLNRYVCGPDLEAISTTTCVPDRCHRSCRTGFIQILTDLGLDVTPPDQ